MYNRRKFVKGITLAAASIPFSGVLASEIIGKQFNKYPILFFTKPLDKYEPEFMAETLAMTGVEGFDLTVRPKGIVLPERVSDDLPKIIEMGRKYNLSSEMMVTAIKNIDEPFAKEVLTVAAKNGIKHYRLGYYNYDLKKGIVESLIDVKSQMKKLAGLNEKLGIQAGYQNHSGTRVGAPVWDVWEVIKDLPREWMSSQFDVRHAVAEGSASWILMMRLLSKNIGSLAIKDSTWDVSKGKARAVKMPLGEGIVDFELYFKTLKELNIVAPITLHVEYKLLNDDEEKKTLLQKQKIFVSKIKKDVDFIKSNLINHQLI